MEFIKTTLKDAYIIKPQVFGDHRGFFLESYSKKKFEEAGIKNEFVQDNHSRSEKKGTLRGMHFQAPPYAQAKLIRVVSGKILDVIIDLRRGSETFGKWETFELSAENFQMLFVPKGFAHGLMTLEDNTEVLYKADNFYEPNSEGGIAWNDPDLKINWPLENPILSERDTKWPTLKNLDNPF
ncbi:MAG: dTDP-4-dehydrorhamnose 3,5-epimerase [Candidatus Moranbacteria bacterium RIFOXYA12_FULL_35_19]|nr:MAG: dTDP-4-dehydrorhamnose 3,5-epimerase [Candidatus Moranbacteria bacterium GW2011_GWF2_35_39]OGI30165.1 MAG: dTDP-4-dehydrorhamnose 3,5-epimerase [Candidatus Moranbacteria bacterium RIFOXYB12_FULL_35_8]OGI33296.1 MAG: dTDP-4-dehydrorhamnose 3,5-epimerase [Candidatus Moranbacteria bacterium RIFOXYC12_FULL_36_13]OGI36814.1 MAG: dTDP-4-dehydrorhamnose 3,5-epimerase [Candidatus Moranbacteria bacterium RIFOXYA12_FULL_35_19]